MNKNAYAHLSQRKAKIMLKVLALLFCGIAMAHGAEAKKVGASSQGYPEKGLWRSQLLCGPTCLYVLLQMNSKKVDYDELVSIAKLEERNVSLTELKRLGARYGLSCEMGRGGRPDLERIVLPAIAHLEPNRPEDDIKGHYVLLLSFDKEHVVYLDGTTAVIGQLHWPEFLKLWSGYFLFVPAHSTRFWSVLTLITACSGAAFGWLICGFVYRWYSRLETGSLESDGVI